VPLTLCSGESATLTVTVDPLGLTSGAMTYTWHGSPGTSSADEYYTGALTSSTTYSVTVINGNGCSYTASPVSITVNELPEVNLLAPAGVCYGEAATLTAEVTGGTTPSMTYTWSQGATPIATTTANTYSISAVTATATYSVTVTNGNSCSYTSAEQTVIAYLLPNLVPGPDMTICYGESVTISATVTNVSSSITWFSDPSYNNPIATANTITVSPVATTDYYIAAVSTEGACTVYGVVRVTVNPMPVVTAPNHTVCLGNEVTVSAIPSESSDVVRWYIDAAHTQFLTQAVSFTVTPTSDTVFYYEAVSIHNCVTRGSVSITVTLPPQVRAMDDLRICYGDEIVLTTLFSDGIISWNVLQTNMRLTASTYYIVTASRPPCPDARDTVHITVGAELYIEPFTLPPFRRGRPFNQQLLTNAESPHTFTLIDGSLPGGIMLQGNGLLSGIPTMGLGDAGNYRFTVQAIDPYRCSVTREYLMRGEFFIPSVFSPDGDGFNDHFMRGYKVVIFDRLGVKMYEGDDGWDGTYKGKVAPVDVYFYVLFYRDANGKEQRETGSITLLR